MRVFITGGSGGIGRALAELYLSRGFEVGICGGSRADFDASGFRHERLSFFEWDVRERARGCEIIAGFARGRLDLMIAAAGINNGRPRDQIKGIDFDRSADIIDINLKGVMNAFEAALEVMRPAGSGHLVALGSASGLSGFPASAAYCASKAAVHVLCESLVFDLEPLGIHVTCVAPGYVDTPLARSTQPGLEKMPGLISAAAAALAIDAAIAQQKPFVVFPFSVGATMRVLSLLPKSSYHRVYRGLEKLLRPKNPPEISQ